MFKFLSFILVLLGLNSSVYGIGADNLLRAEQAFKLEAQLQDRSHIKLQFGIEAGYYLYRDRISVSADNPALSLGKPDFPPAQLKQDDNFGEMYIYREQATIVLPFQLPENQTAFEIKVKYQGCADIGVCYPPLINVFKFDLSALPESPTNKTDPQGASVNLERLLKSNSPLGAAQELLPADQAFQLFVKAKNANTLELSWLIADGYYLYREKFKFNVISPPGVNSGSYDIPRGLAKHDEAFGDVEIFHKDVKFDIPLIGLIEGAKLVEISVAYQGCAEKGICYPPITKQIQLDLTAATQTQVKESPSPSSELSALSEQDQIALALHQNSFWLSMLTFLGFGLLLAFTPCVFPMIPILSGIIIGKGGKTASTRNAFLLSLSYVLAGALTYTLFGVLAALFGSNLQATLQQAWIIYLFSGLFVALALSMFGFYHLELPKALQAKLHSSSDKYRNGSYWGAAMMGAFSSLIVGPCVAAPLAAALIYIGQSGDVFLGGAALFMMGLGMGLPLLVIGTSAGKWLPKAGHWLNRTKAVCGVIMLAMAVWMLQRVVAPGISMFLWALLLIVPSVYLSALDNLPEHCSPWQRFWKGIGIVMFLYGTLILIGMTLGSGNPLLPLAGITPGQAATNEADLKFKAIKGLAQLESELADASAQQQAVVLDFYADWCISCKEMEAYTFKDASVRQRLAKFRLLRADVTANDELDRALLKKFELIGPPAILFFSTDQNEIRSKRVIGFKDSREFLDIIPSP